MIKCNPISNYPTKVDELVFFQDNDLENINVVNEYNRLINEGKYDKAIQYVADNGNIYGFFADFFNLIENRIYNLQEYESEKYKTPKIQPFVYYDFMSYDLTVFTNTGAQETTENIYIFSNDGTSEQFEELTIFTGNNYVDEVGKDEMEPLDLHDYTIWI